MSVGGSQQAVQGRNAGGESQCRHRSKVAGTGASCRRGRGCEQKVPAQVLVIGAGAVEPGGLAGCVRPWRASGLTCALGRVDYAGAGDRSHAWIKR